MGKKRGARRITVGSTILARLRLKRSLQRVKAELKTTLRLALVDGVTIGEMGKTIGIGQAVDDLLKEMPTGNLNRDGKTANLAAH